MKYSVGSQLWWKSHLHLGISAQSSVVRARNSRDPRAHPIELFAPDLVLFFFCLRGKSWKFQAPAVIHVSPLLTAYALTSIRPRPSTIISRKPYSRKMVLTYQFFIMLIPLANCLPFLTIISPHPARISWIAHAATASWFLSSPALASYEP